MTVCFDIPGEPVGKARPRVVINEKTHKSHAFTEKGTIAYENLVKISYRDACRESFESGAMIEVSIDAFYKIPKSVSKKKREQMLEGGIRPTKRPDLDNICKAILDALNGIAYHDDSQVVTVMLSKRFSDTPHVEVCMWEVKD